MTKLWHFASIFLCSLAISIFICYTLLQTLTETRSHITLIGLTGGLFILIYMNIRRISFDWYMIFGAFYFTWMSTLLIFRPIEFSTHGLNLVPFVHSLQMINHLSFREIIWYFGGNTLLFIPMGYFFAYLTSSITFSTLYGFIMMIVVEILQGLTNRGVLDIDDLIMNVFGILIGGLLRIGLIGLGKNQKVHNTN